MNRSLKLSLLLALALGSSQAVALELGQIHVKSALGQPLVAEIPVTPEGAADLRNLSAKLASEEDFLRAGITDGRPRVPLSFSVVNGAGGSKLIRITSTQAINDPFLDLLVEVDNAAGKSLREYTILLDPPGTVAAPAPAPASRPAARPSSRASAPAPAPAAPAKRPAAAPAVAANGQIAVQRGQTLSGIATQARPDGVDLNQMLLAFKQANPDAFYRDNINALKSGAVLRVPSADEARAMTVAAAMAEVRRQNSDWRAGTVSAPTNVADTATRAGASSSPTAPASKPGDHLELLPSGAGSKAASTGGGKASEVRRDLQRSQEALANLQQQSADLRSRLKDLEDINSKNQRLLSLKDNEIAELQRKLAEAKGKSAGGETASAPVAAPVAPTATETKPATPPATAAAVAPGQASTAASAPATATAASTKAPAAAATAMAKPQASQPATKPAAKPPVAKKPVPKPTRTTEEPWYMQTWAWGAGAAAVVLLLLLALRGRRGKPSGKQPASSLADRFGAVPPIDSDSDDPDQDELLDQLAENPDDISLHLELVSLYYHRRDVEHFEAAAEAMYAHITDPQQSEWQDVAAMGEDLVPGHPLFAGVDTSVPEDERAPLGGFNLDEAEEADGDAYTPAAPVPPPAASGPSKISEYHFDFNLTPRHDAPRQPPPMPPAETEQSEVDDAFADLHEPEELPEAAPETPSWSPGEADTGFEPTEFSDDPVDTKLDLARAYLDMGDADGARAMLEEVLTEGTQAQRDTARRLLDGIA